MIHHRAEDDVRDLFALGFGKRPREELYDLAADPDHMTNLADMPEHEAIKAELCDQLMDVLREQDDPRLVETPCRYEHVPYAGDLGEGPWGQPDLWTADGHRKDPNS